MIYAIRAVGTEFVKFGRAKDPVKRLSSLQVSSPYELKLIACAEWPDSEEALIHAYLAHYHARGEWFVAGGKTENVIGLLRDGERGQEEWKRLKHSNPELRRSLKAVSSLHLQELTPSKSWSVT